MADLDDFFAKKDRRRNKGGAKPEEGKKERERPRPREEEDRRGGEEEEWKEYEEQVKDYSGLKIQVLQGGAAAPEAPSGDEAVTQDSTKTKGPWNKPEAVEQPPPPVAPQPKPAEPPKAALYRPPRRLEAAEQPVAPRRNQHAHAPDIRNADYFPVLGATSKPRGGGWSTATTGSSAPRQTAQRRPLALDNRFTSLQEDS